MKFGRRVVYRPGVFARLLIKTTWKLTFTPEIPDRVQLTAGNAVDLLCSEFAGISTTSEKLWHTVEITTTTKIFSLPFLSARRARKLSAHLLEFINRFLISAMEADRAQLIEIDSALQVLFRKNRQYLARADLSHAVSSVPGQAAAAVLHPLLDLARVPGALLRLYPATFSMLTDPNARARYNDRFVMHELNRYSAFFSDLSGMSLSAEQREACIRLEDNNLLVAPAGSGKTATMVGKVAYVLDKGLFRAEEILILAFNNSAASELRRRLASQLGVDEKALGTNVTTFHALGRGIIKQAHGRPPQLANWVEHPSGEARVIDQLISEQVQQNPEFRKLWFELLVLFPKAEDTAIDAEEDVTRYLAERDKGRSATIGTLSGIFVRSLEEVKIANWLWLNSIPFEYEQQLQLKNEPDAHRYVHPDFHYPQTDTWHEHFAINQDGTSPFENYVEHTETKRVAYKRAAVDFFETSSAMAKTDTLLPELEAQLSKRGITFKSRNDEEIRKAVSPTVIKLYQKLFSVCIKHIRSSHLTPDMLQARASTLRDPARARRFATVVWHLAEAYSKKLADDQRIDFDSMIGGAVSLIDSSQYRSPYSLILVDEFQDISDSRANLIKALKRQNPMAKVFAVGDDWQSIYRFSGSDISIFTRFEEHFGNRWLGRLEQTYRCNQLIADTAARFVQANPEQLRKSVRSSRAGIPRSIRVVPVKIKKNERSIADACGQVLDRLNLFAQKIAAQWQSEKTRKLKVLVLSRYNMINPYSGEEPIFSHIEIRSLTFHRAKGLEADYTVLLDVSEGDYGVPSQIESDELLNLVIPIPETYPFAEERRLMYVVLTRASRGVYILANEDKPSRFISEFQAISGDNIQFEDLDGTPFLPCPRCTAGRLVVRTTTEGVTLLRCDQFPQCDETRSLA